MSLDSDFCFAGFIMVVLLLYHKQPQTLANRFKKQPKGGFDVTLSVLIGTLA